MWSLIVGTYALIEGRRRVQVHNSESTTLWDSEGPCAAVFVLQHPVLAKSLGLRVKGLGLRVKGLRLVVSQVGHPNIHPQIP